QRVTAVLDRAQLHHGQLLGGLGAVEGGVVGLYRQNLGAPVDGVADDAVVGDLEADHVTDGGRPDPQHPRLVAGDEVGRDPGDLGGHHPGDTAQRHVLGEGHRVALDVLAGDVLVGDPDQAGVLDAV